MKKLLMSFEDVSPKRRPIVLRVLDLNRYGEVERILVPLDVDQVFWNTLNDSSSIQIV